MILEVEAREAKAHWENYVCALAALGAGECVLSAVLLSGVLHAAGPLAVMTVASAACFVGMRRCRKTLLGWRDQRRLIALQEEADKLSAPMLRSAKGGRG